MSENFNLGENISYIKAQCFVIKGLLMDVQKIYNNIKSCK